MPLHFTRLLLYLYLDMSHYLHNPTEASENPAIPLLSCHRASPWRLVAISHANDCFSVADTGNGYRPLSVHPFSSRLYALRDLA